MRRSKALWIVAVAAVALAICGGCSLQKDDAKTRVENVLNGMTKDYLSNEYQVAICQWLDGSYAMNQSDLEYTMGKFEAWYKARAIQTPIGGFTIEKVTMVPGASPPSSIVDVTIDGAPYTIKVIKGEPMEWAGP
jgi:hypothetical protein